MYDPSEVAERIKMLMKEQKIKTADMYQALDISNNTMTRMKKSYPNSDTIAKIADYIGCSVDYLLGRTECREVNNGQSSLPESDVKLLNDIRRLDDDGRLMVFSALLCETRRMQKGELRSADEPDDSDAE